MLSTLELERLTEADVGRCLADTAGLIGRVRLEPCPSTRVVVDFTVPTGRPGQEREVGAGVWPDRSLAEIRQNAQRLRQTPQAEAREPALAGASAQALYHGPATTTVSVRPPPRPMARLNDGPLFESLRPEAPAVAQVPLTIAELFDHWLRQALAGRKDGGESVRRSMQKDVLPFLGSAATATVRRSQIMTLLERIVARGSARQAGCVLADLRQMFRWAIESRLIETDPTAQLRKSDFGGVAQVRRRHLSSAELAELAAKMSSVRLARHVRHAIWLLLATGARIGELATARWQDIDLTRRIWTIPAHLSHSGHAHEIALSDFALRHLQPPGEPTCSAEWVFPSRYPTEPLSPKALGKQIRDRQRGTQIRGRASGTTSLLLAGGAWTPLDLRRSTAAFMAELDIRPDIIAHCLDQSTRSTHSRTAPAGVDLNVARRAAFDRLGAYLDAIELAHQRPGRRSLAR